MPESKGRDHKATAYTPPRTSKAVEPNPTWWAPVFVTLLVLGLLWIVVYYVTEYKYRSARSGSGTSPSGSSCSWVVSS